MLPTRPLKSYKICNKIFEHGFDPLPSPWTMLKKCGFGGGWHPLYSIQIYVLQNIQIPQPCARKAHRNPLPDIYPPVYIQYQNIYSSYKYSQMIGSLHLIPTYIFNLQIFPKCWPYRSNTNIFITKCTFPKFAPSNRHASPDCLQIISKTCWIGVSKYCCIF